MKKIFLLLFTITSLVAAAQNLTKTFDSLTTAYEQNGYHGVILVAKGDKVLFNRGYGYANFEKKIQHTPSTLFKTESVGKMFTAVSVLQLIESGKLSVDQDVKSLLPELNIKNSDKITVHQLLNHTSGLQSPWDHPEFNFKKDYTRKEWEKIIEEVPLTFDVPGQQMFYSNSGYIILGWIIEKISGKTFDTYFQDEIFSKLKMTNTGHLNDTVMPAVNGAQPYKILNSSRYVLLNDKVGRKAAAAGGWISNSQDLHRFMSALHQNKLIKPQTWEMMRTANGNAPKDSSFRYYAYGLETYINRQIPGANIYGHNGGGAGFSIDAFVDANTGFIVVSCTNIYQNSRLLAMNYLKAALQKNISPVQPMLWVKIYDAIEAKGIDAFIKNGKENLEQLNEKPHPMMFAEVADAMDEAKDFTTMAKWLDFASTFFPEEPYITLLRGDSQLKLGNKESAKQLYLTVKDLSEKRKDQQMITMINNKLKEL